MAIRLLPRLRIRPTLPTSPKIPPYHLHKIRPFTQPPNFTHQVALANLLHRHGFSASQLHHFINSNPNLCSVPPPAAARCIATLLSLGLAPKTLPTFLPSCPLALDPTFLTKWTDLLSTLNFSSVPASQILQQCARLRISPDHLRRTVSSLRNIGFRDITLSGMFKEVPQVFMKDTAGAACKAASAAGIDVSYIDRVCYEYPGFLALSAEQRIMPLFNEFRELGFSISEVKKAMLDDPKVVLGLECGEITLCVRLLRSLKCRVMIKERILAGGLLRAGIAVKVRVDCLCRWGLIRRDAFKVVFVEPRVILYGVEEIEEKIKFLMDRIGLGMEAVVEFPEYLGLNLEKQIVPRWNVVEHLRSIGGLAFEVEMKDIVRLSRLRFYNLYVKPYPECEEMFGKVLAETEGKAQPRHPPGLWKLFKPQKHSETGEDIKNMKLFMDPR